MNINEYQELAMTTLNPELSKRDVLINSVMGLCGESGEAIDCQTAHCGRYIPHFDFGAKPSPIVPYRHLPQSLSGMTADCRSLV